MTINLSGNRVRDLIEALATIDPDAVTDVERIDVLVSDGTGRTAHLTADLLRELDDLRAELASAEAEIRDLTDELHRSCK